MAQGYAVAVCEHREYIDRWRVRTQFICASRHKLNSRPGRRVTDRLSKEGLRQLADSCEYLHYTDRQYTTAMTLTFDAPARSQLELGEMVMQTELSRFLDSVKKMYRRGWQGETQSGEPFREIGHPNDQFLYLWVIEAPTNVRGDPNPHIHLLIRWQVPYAHFIAWTQRLESIWNHGFVHTERIHKPRSIGGYLMKAVGYTLKGSKDGQGQIEGNRYFISSTARAPKWDIQWIRPLGILPQLMQAARDHYWEQNAEQYQRRRTFKKLLNQLPDPQDPLRQRCLEEIASVGKVLRDWPIHPSTYQIVFNGTGALVEFFRWAMGKFQIDWLPAIAPARWNPAEERAPNPAVQELRRWTDRAVRLREWKRLFDDFDPESPASVNDREARWRSVLASFERWVDPSLHS